MPLPVVSARPAPPAAAGFEDLVDLARIALPDLSPGKDPEGKAAEAVRLFREYLRAVGPERREAPLLAAARHALLESRAAGRPSLGSYACRAVVGTTIPKVMELCHPDWPAYRGVVARYHDNGLFANVLQVCDLLLLSSPDAVVLVDWQRQGSEGHFQYGPPGSDLWARLFVQSERCHSSRGEGLPSPLVEMPSRINCVFMNMLRGYVWSLPGSELSSLRHAYAGALSAALLPAPQVQARVAEVVDAWRGGGGADAAVVGVHKRLGTPEVVAVQLSQRAPANEEFAARARCLLEQAPASARKIVFLATDDVHAVEAFQQAFPAGGSVELVCRTGVKRSIGGVREDGVDNEVHRSPCEAVDAEDALVDALCLSRCDDLVCMDSNLAIFAALFNPVLRLHPLNGILPEGWEKAADKPIEAVYKAYQVVYSPMVFVRSAPSAASELLGARKAGERVETTGRGFDGWVELREGGWMLVDAERQLIGRGKGALLEAAGPPWPVAVPPS